MKTKIVFNVGDYHEFDGIQDILTSFTGKKFKYKEITISSSCYGYSAVFYIGKCPSDKVIKKMHNKWLWSLVDNR